ncbi:hypothetical protein PI95_030440 [Hassallia byssoidea VB512170]|uniref:Uncharacterized protein n=1 Tax=Hassallia byssoidea VB512170 TaxID=1304833 RepID=A0A846HHA3_9CYAN|nr:hypothetical protein [Hassalia byssoidea]NEU76712.1 hypothetical protein [Hassalia byssoidea VB512170]
MRTINVSEFCVQSGINTDVFRDTIEAMKLDRNIEELGLDILEAIAQEIAQQNGTQLSLPAADKSVSESDKIVIKEAVGLAFEFYPELMALNDLQVVQVAAFLTAERQADAFETIHSAVINQRLTAYRTKTNASLLANITAVQGVSDADFLAARGFQMTKPQTDSALSELLKMQKN